LLQQPLKPIDISSNNDCGIVNRKLIDKERTLVSTKPTVTAKSTQRGRLESITHDATQNKTGTCQIRIVILEQIDTPTRLS